MTTVYKNAGKVLFVDQDDAYTPEEVRIHYAQFDKSLLQATYTVIPPKKEGGKRTIEFAKRTGTKGGNVHPVIAALLNASPSAIVLAADAAMVQADCPVRKVVDDAYDLSTRINRKVIECLCLTPVPSPRPPRGF